MVMTYLGSETGETSLTKRSDAIPVDNIGMIQITTKGAINYVFWMVRANS